MKFINGIYWISRKSAEVYNCIDKIGSLIFCLHF